MHPFSLIAAAMALTVSSMFDGLVHFIGTVVILVSVGWSAFCLLSYLVRRSAPAAPPASVPVAATPRPLHPPHLESSSPAHSIPDHIIAVIAAAVYTALDDKHRIISIKPQDSAWEKAGRQAILTSHRIR